jgi:hypothetical protein
MKKSMILLLLLSGLVLSCESGPKPPEVPLEVEVKQEQEQEPVAPNVTSQVEKPAEKPDQVTVETPKKEEFDPNTISEARFQAAKKDIEAFIVELNGIIRARNYAAWVAHLDTSYFDEIRSSSFLEEKTEDLYLRDQVVAQNAGRDPRMVAKRILRTPRDYFDYVVVPSRANDRLDDIAFISETHVRAYTIDGRGQRLVLYELASINNKWLIVD